MSLITSCPACGTMFRVVPDQLKISEGWVRCGHCAEVFDAAAHLAEEESRFSGLAGLDAADPPQQDPPATGRDDPIRGWEATAASSLTNPGGLGTQPAPLGRRVPSATDPAVAPGAAAGPASTFEAEAPDSRSLEPTELDAPFVFRRSDLMELDPVPSVLPPPGPNFDSHLPADEDAQLDALDRASFVRQARRKAFWRRPLARTVLALLALVLAAGLLLQVAVQDRDRLALAQPQLRPLLQRVCEELQCRIGPPRQIEAVVIESSGFNKLRNDTYRLSFTLRNAAPVTVAAPAMELTLTDAQDQPLLRRVLTPAELGARDDTIAAAGEWTGSAGILVSSSGARIAGYRLLAFYP